MARELNPSINYTKTIISASVEETYDLSKAVAKGLERNSIVAFYGDLGAGKTTFIKGIVSSLGQIPKEEITSPTFIYMNSYEADIPVYHFDLYKIQATDQFIEMGLQEYFTAGGICLIEWADKIQSLLPKNCYQIRMVHLEDNKRQITISLP